MSSGSGFRALPAQARTAIVVSALAGGAATIDSIMLQRSWDAVALVGLLALAMITARVKVKLTGSSTLSLLTATVLLSLMVGGTAVAVLVGMCGVLTQSIQPRKPVVLHQIMFNISMIAMTVTLAGRGYEAVLSENQPAFMNHLVGMFAASLIYFIGNSGFVSIIIGLSKATSPVTIWAKHFANTAPSFLIAGVLSLFTLELLSNPALIVLTLPVLSLVYYSSIRLNVSRAV
jgi:hypothetical protein